MKKLIFLILAALPLGAQVVVGNYGVKYVSSPPSGSCGSTSALTIVQSTGVMYTCQSGTWGAVTGGGGGGTPGGSSPQLQYNNAGVFGGTTNINYSSNAGGSIGIGTTNPLASIHVISNSGNVQIGNNGNAGYGMITFQSAAPTTNQYSLMGDGSRTLVGSPSGNVEIRPGGSFSPPGAVFTATTLLVGLNGSTPAGKLDMMYGATAATGTTNVNSGDIRLTGSYYNGTAGANDYWAIQNVIGPAAGDPTPTSTLTFAHSGSGGTASVVIPTPATSTAPGLAFSTQTTTGIGIDASTGGLALIAGATEMAMLRTSSINLYGPPWSWQSSGNTSPVWNVGAITGVAMTVGYNGTASIAFGTNGNTYWGTPTAATSGANQNSPTLNINANYYNASNTSVPDTWTAQNIIQTGTTPNSQLLWTHTGSPGSGSGGPTFAVRSVSANVLVTTTSLNTTGSDLQLQAQSGINGVVHDAAGLFLSSNAATGVLIGYIGGTNRGLQVGPTLGVNYFQMSGGIAGVSPILAAVGSDTNLNMVLTPKGTGAGGGVIVFSDNLTVANLPACAAALQGARAAVTDAVTPSFLGTLTGGGSVYTPVVCNGTAWVAH